MIYPTKAIQFINERSEFLRSLSDKSEYEWPSPTHADAYERLRYSFETGYDFHVFFTGK